MARRKIKDPSARINKWIKEGRGSGEGANYKPWLRIQDVPSRGYAKRVVGWKTGREHHLLSNLELDVFYTFEWASAVLDIREQFPLLPLELTLSIAHKLGVSHPKEPGTCAPIVMTSDFVITQKGLFSNEELAVCVKPSAELDSERVRQKLAIEQVYWKTRSIRWVVFTEREISEARAFNVRWIHEYLDASQLPETTEIVRKHVAQLLIHLLTDGLTLAEATCIADDRLALLAGTSLCLVRHFIAARRWGVDMDKKIDPQQTLPLLKTAAEDFSNGDLRQQSA